MNKSLETAPWLAQGRNNFYYYCKRPLHSHTNKYRTEGLLGVYPIGLFPL